MDQLMNLKQSLARLGTAKLTAMGAAVAILLLGIVWLASQSHEPMGLLYSGLDLAEAGRVGDKLQELKVPFEVKGDGSMLMVPESQVARVRMELAAAGLPGQQGAGYELLDKQSPMNMTSFMQRVQWTRALEGELAHTIVALDGVRTARVHIVLPERDTFERQAPKPTASVAVVMDGAMRLSPSQAAAIRLLVSGAVPGLARDDVSVLDPNGIVLAANSGDTLVSDQLIAMKQAREQALQKSVTDLLQPLVGAGNVRVIASVEIDDSREVSHDVKFDPQSQVERSKQSQVDKQQSTDNKPQQPVSVGQNLPNPPPQTGNGEQTSSSSSHDGQTINYEINSTRTDSVREPGDTRRLTVAVLVDGLNGGKGTFEPRSKQQLEQIAALVRSAVGFDAKRGDVITVDSMPFVASEAAGVSASAAMPGNGMPLSLLLSGAIVLILVIAAGAVYLLMWRNNTKIALAAIEVETPALELAESAAALLPLQIEEAKAQFPALPAPEVNAPLAALYDLVDTRPEEALAVLRAWISDNS